MQPRQTKFLKLTNGRHRQADAIAVLLPLAPRPLLKLLPPPFFADFGRRCNSSRCVQTRQDADIFRTQAFRRNSPPLSRP